MAPKKKLTRKRKARKRGSFNIRINPSEEDLSTPNKTAGVRSGLGLFTFVKILLETNEGLTKSQKITDQELARLLVEEFPTRTKRLKEGKITMGYYRTRYNRGNLTQGIVPPVKSHRFTDDGRVANNWSGKPAVDVSKGASEVEATEKIKKLLGGSKAKKRKVKTGPVYDPPQETAGVKQLRRKAERLKKFLNGLSRLDRMNFETLIGFENREEVISKLPDGAYKDHAVIALVLMEGLKGELSASLNDIADDGGSEGTGLQVPNR